MSERPLRIAQVAPLWMGIPPANYGGIELLVHLLTAELMRRGHEVTLFASGDSKTNAMLHAVTEENLVTLMERGASLYEFYTNAAAAEAVQRQEDFDLIHFHSGLIAVPIAALAHVPCLFTLHSLTTVDEQWMIGRYPQTNVVGISRSQIADLRPNRRETPVIYNGIDFDSYEPRYEQGEYLVFLGRMSREKNPLGAIRLAAEIGLPIVLAGKPQNGIEEEYFAQEIEPLIDGRSVRWAGPVNHEQKNELLRHASALLFPVLWPEPFGLVMIEAMACGTPVVGTTIGSVPEVVDAGLTGFHAADLEALPELVLGALRLDRRQVRACAEERFAYRHMVSRYLQTYRQLLRQTGR